MLKSRTTPMVPADSMVPLPDGNRFPLFNIAGDYTVRQVPLAEEDAINSGVITVRMKALTQDAHLSILVVDDDEIELALIGDQLAARGLDVSRASNGKEALALIAERFFPVLLTDWQMPLMDGIELAERVRALGMDGTFIVMLTGRDGRFDYRRGYEAGVDDYLTKKLPDVELYARITAAFGTAALRRSLKEARAALALAENGKQSTEQSKPRDVEQIKGVTEERESVTVTQHITEAPEPQELPVGRSRALSEDFGSTTVLSLAIMPVPRLLLVDDDEIMTEHLKISMVGAGYDVRTVCDGAGALAVLQRDFRSIVILDRSMPGMDGLALCRAIRGRSWPGYIYIMLLTAHEAEADILLGLDAGADDYLSKRVSDAELIARLNTATRVLSLEHSLKGALEERRRMAMTDPLTGAHNRRYFVRYLGAELKRARRFRSDLSLLLLDVDHFKQVNDTHGHAGGDIVLQKLVKRIQTCLPRDFDWCARLGGEEFAVVLPQTDLAGAAVVAERLRKAVEELPIRLSGAVRSVTVSVGVGGLQAMPMRDTVTVEMLLAQADQYLYKSKAAGRNNVTTPVLTAAPL
ncbi:MAG: diguanylate cyclase [Pseudomonadota bacterium]|nr:diguanylate cyclase [Pseudomonadota bacterium]